MNLSTYNILVILALVFTVLSIAAPKYPLLAVAVLLICVACLIK